MKEDIQVSATNPEPWSQYPYWAHSFTFHLHLYMTASTTTSKTSTEYYHPRWIWKRTFGSVKSIQCHGPSILSELTVSLFIYTCIWQWAPPHQKPSQNIIILGEYERGHLGECNQSRAMVPVSLMSSQFHFSFTPVYDSEHHHIKNLHRILSS
jgi:hypothetical protein